MTFGGLAARWRGARPAVGLVAWWLGGSVARWPGGLVARRPGGRVRARAASSMVGGGRGAARAAGRLEGACEDHLQTAMTGPNADAEGDHVQLAHDSVTRTSGARTIATDALPANRIFRLAIDRFDRALTALDTGAQGSLPSTERVLDALEQAQRGATLLGSALVPSVTFVDQQRALGAIAQASGGVDELQTLVELADAHADRAEQYDALVAARGFLDVARAILSTDAS